MYVYIYIYILYIYLEAHAAMDFFLEVYNYEIIHIVSVHFS
jgi:hypothetical protein